MGLSEKVKSGVEWKSKKLGLSENVKSLIEWKSKKWGWVKNQNVGLCEKAKRWVKLTGNIGVEWKSNKWIWVKQQKGWSLTVRYYKGRKWSLWASYNPKWCKSISSELVKMYRHFFSWKTAEGHFFVKYQYMDKVKRIFVAHYQNFILVWKTFLLG